MCALRPLSTADIISDKIRADSNRAFRKKKKRSSITATETHTEQHQAPQYALMSNRRNNN